MDVIQEAIFMQQVRAAVEIDPQNKEEKKYQNGFCQWSSSDDVRFFASSKTHDYLPRGVYDVCHSPNGIFFQKIPVFCSDIIRFPDATSDLVISEIEKFWEREHVFREYKLIYKRGIILYGPPGSGKSSTIQLIMNDVIKRNGVVIKFTHPQIFNEGIRSFREIEPNTPLVVLMEDIDSIIRNFSESEVLNILDGVNQIDKVVFLATTNYPEDLGERIINRPSRFDKRYKIGVPNMECRRIYFEHVINGKIDELNINLDQWVKDTENMSIAHLKELFTSVVILGNSYEDSIEALKAMDSESPHSDYDKKEKKKCVGFSSGANPFFGSKYSDSSND